MARKRYSSEDIIGKLRSAEVWLAEGVSVGEVVRRLGVQRVAYDRWRKESVWRDGRRSGAPSART